MKQPAPRPDSLEPLPGEAARPALRLLERSGAVRPRPGRPAGMPAAAAADWLSRLRSVARRAFAG